jgi:hypothetical protein
MKNQIKLNQVLILLILTFVGQINVVKAQIPKIVNSNAKLTTNLKNLRPILLNYTIKTEKKETATTPSTDCPGTTVTCTTTRADLTSPLFGTSLFSLPNELFLGNIFDLTEYTSSGTMNSKQLGARNKITVSAYSHSFGGTEPEEINPTNTQYMAFLTRARNALDKLIGDDRPIESAEYKLESITSKDQMKATLGATYSDPQNYFDFGSSVSSSSQKQYVVLKFVEKSFEVAMDDPANGFLVSPTTLSSSLAFVSNIKYGRFALLIFETNRSDFDLKATLEAGLNIPETAKVGVNASLDLSNVQSNIKVKLVLQGFNANPSYSSLLSKTVLDDSIVDKINEIIGGAIGTREAAIPIVITAKKATLIDNSYPEITQKVTFSNVPISKECVTNYPLSAITYKYKVTFNKIYSTKAGWGGSEQLYGSLRCNMFAASKEGISKKTFNLASLSKPNEIELKEKEKEYNLSGLIPGLKPYEVVFTKPECITEKDFLEKSFIDMSAPLYIDRTPGAKDELFKKSSRYKRHYLNKISNKIGPYENFGNSCNAANEGIICTTTADGQNFQISYTIEKIN